MHMQVCCRSLSKLRVLACAIAVVPAVSLSVRVPSRYYEHVIAAIPRVQEGTVSHTPPVKNAPVSPTDDIKMAKPAGLEPDAIAERRRSEVLSLIRYPWQTLGYEIVFLAPRPGYRAMTIAGKHRIEVYARPGESPLAQAYDLAHELGHAFDLEFNNAERRARWLELRRVDRGKRWFGCDGCSDYDTPSGDFAETFAFLLLGPGNYHSRLALPPTPTEITALAAFCGIEPVSAP